MLIIPECLFHLVLNAATAQAKDKTVPVAPPKRNPCTNYACLGKD